MTALLSILVLAVLLITVGIGYVNSINALREERRRYIADIGKLKAERDSAVTRLKTQTQAIQQLSDSVQTLALDLPIQYELRQVVSMLTTLLPKLPTPQDLNTPYIEKLKKPEYEVASLERLLKGLGKTEIEKHWHSGTYQDLLSIVDIVVKEAKAQYLQAIADRDAAIKAEAEAAQQPNQ